MQVLLIGGSGILSTDVCREALKRRNEVYLINRGERKYALNNDAQLIVCDIHNESIDSIRSKIVNYFFDVVIDFLAFKPYDVEKHLEALKGHCHQYIFISTATVYKKESENEIISEDTPVGNNRWEYASNKAACEQFLKREYEHYCKHWTIIRPYVTYNETRIPYALIRSHDYWSIINRINHNKPIVMWDGGNAKCTITHSHDFAVGTVGLFGNPKSYEEDFHITSDFVSNWKEIVEEEIQAIGKQTEIIDMNTSFIINILPEYSGVLLGDKGTNMVFNNAKIKNAVPNFKSEISFSDGIRNTISYLKEHKELQKVDYKWEGRMDYLLKQYYKKNHIRSKCKIGIKNYEHIKMKDKLTYYFYRNKVLYDCIQLEHKYGRIIRNVVKHSLWKRKA